MLTENASVEWQLVVEKQTFLWPLAMATAEGEQVRNEGIIKCCKENLIYVGSCSSGLII